MPSCCSTLRKGVAASVLSLGLVSSSALADETDAKQILQAMSDYLSGEQSLSFDYDSMLEIVTTEDQKLGITASGTVTLTRPDKLRATRQGGFSDIEMVFDGETFSLLGDHAGIYTQFPAKGSIDELVDLLREEYGRPLPAADLLAGAPYEILMSEVTDVKDMGVGVIGGKVCDHLAFRTPEVDWQIWIATDGTPHPCRYVITTHTLTQGPQYVVDIRDWRDDPEIADESFAFTAPSGATGVEFEEYHKAGGELPDHYRTGESK
ncbi:DUF2092 domain-containing protein [Ruegeria sp. HKCCA5763]|uniref:DUF2092 domain-containing protein n=1 Tax=Ruegeria sp. HKCCA5763 TaxID=2682987 RepID=UPI001487CC55|nr:DUF2092 domain-containing protein [Ruegeria sp. HKCCA5763]